MKTLTIRIKLPLRVLAAVSNNSVITNKVLIALNDKLSNDEKREFKRWLQLVELAKKTAVNRAKKKIRF
jgi:hypothetical protein